MFNWVESLINILRIVLNNLFCLLELSELIESIAENCFFVEQTQRYDNLNCFRENQ